MTVQELVEVVHERAPGFEVTVYVTAAPLPESDSFHSTVTDLLAAVTDGVVGAHGAMIGASDVARSRLAVL